MKKYIFSLLLSLGALSGMSQVSPLLGGNYLEFLEQATLSGATYAMYQKQFRADSLMARRGLNPDDPEVSVDVFPFQKGAATSAELSVEQSFDFPTLYVQRKKISGLTIQRAATETLSRRRELMVELSDAYLNYVKLTKLHTLLAERAASLDRLATFNLSAQQAGGLGSLEVAKSQTMASTSHAELLEVESGLLQTQRLLSYLIGSSAASLGQQQYPILEIPGSQAQFVDAAFAASPQSELQRLDSLIAKRTLSLSRSEWAPKIKLGYRADFEGPEVRHALKAGISIPLWQNRGNVKYSKALIEATAARNADSQHRLELSFNEIYGQWASARKGVEYYAKNVKDGHYANILDKSLEGGMVNSTEFLLLLTDWMASQRALIEMEYTATQLEAVMAIMSYKM